MSSIYFGAHQRTGNACDFEALQYAKTFQASCFRSQMYLGALVANQVIFVECTVRLAQTNAALLTLAVFQGWDHSASALVVLESKLLRTKTHDGFIWGFP